MTLNVQFRFIDFRKKVVHDVKILELEKEDIDGKELLDKLADHINTPATEIDLFYAGKKVSPTSDYNLCASAGYKAGGCIKVLYKPQEKNVQPSKSVDAGELKMCMAGLHLMLNNRHQKWKSRKAVLKILKDDESFQSVLDAVPGLKDDHSSIDILRNADLFSSIVDPKNTERVLELHENLAAAIVEISHKISATWNSSTSAGQQDMAMETDSSPSTSRGIRRLNRPAPFSAQQGSRTPGIITSNQLAQALSLANTPASGRIFPSPMSSGTPGSVQSPHTGASSTSSSTPLLGDAGGSARGAITPDVFSRAMQAALAQNDAASGRSNSSNTSTPPQIPENVMQSGLEQLRSMGISDEEASRQALIVTRGDVQAAVNMLFASGMDDL